MSSSYQAVENFLTLNPTIFSDFFGNDRLSDPKTMMEKFDNDPDFRSHVKEAMTEAEQVHAEDEQIKRDLIYG